MYNFTPTPKLNPVLKKAFYLILSNGMSAKHLVNEITNTFLKKVIRDVLEPSRKSNETSLQK